MCFLQSLSFKWERNKSGKNSGRIQADNRRIVPTDEDIKNMRKIASLYRNYGRYKEEYTEYTDELHSKNQWSKLNKDEIKKEIEDTQEH